VKKDFDCEADSHEGILILTDRTYRSAKAIAVKNLRKELPAILAPLGEDTVAYWRMEDDEKERERIFAGLKDTPIFDDILG